MYGEHQGDHNVAAQAYAERFPQKRHPRKQTFQQLFNRLSVDGYFICTRTEQPLQHFLILKQLIISIKKLPQIFTRSARILSVMAHKSVLTVTKVPSSPTLHPLFNKILMSLWTHYCVGSQSFNIILTVHESSQQ